MIGCGTVGSGVARLLKDQADLYANRLGARLELRRMLVRDVTRPRDVPGLDASMLTDDPDAFYATPEMPLVIEVAGGTGKIREYVLRALNEGKPIVTANKSLLAAHGAEIHAAARAKNVSVGFEASCGGGIPMVTALKFGLMANRIEALFGILNGTCNFILTAMTRDGKTYDDALAEAQKLGYAEADPTLDVSGRDAAEKLAILASLAFGVRVDPETVQCEGIDGIDLADLRFGAELGYDIKLLAIAERQGQSESISLRVHPCFISEQSPLAQVRDAFNALSVFGHAVGHTMFFGRGAGQMPTASAVVSDLINVASGWYARAFTEMNLWCDRKDPPRLVEHGELIGRYYLRVNALDVPGVTAQATKILGDLGISLSAVLQHEVAVGQFVPLVIMTHHAKQGAMDEAVAALEHLEVIDGKPVVLHVVELPEG